MRRTIATLAAISAIGMSATTMLVATPAAAHSSCGVDRFCAYREHGYTNKLIESAATRGANVDVADNLVSSVSNRRNNAWFGRDGRGALPDITVFTFGPQTDVSYVGDGPNDKIDYFIVD